MSTYLRNCKFGLLLCGLLLLPSVISGQDLGSSSGLFRPSKAKKTTSRKKKESPKKKKSVSRRRKCSAKSNRKSSRRKTSVVRSRKSNKKSNISKKGKTTSKLGSKTALKRPGKNFIPSKKIIIYGGNGGGNPSEMLERTIEKGNIARNRRQYKEAEIAYRLARKMDDKDSRPVYGLGNLFSDQQRWEEAENAYRRAIQIEPRSPAPYIAISFVLTRPVVGANLGRRYVEAEKMARRAIVLSPQNPIAFDQLGVALESRGIISAQTQNVYRKAIELDPAFALAYAHLGRILLRNGLARESSSAYARAVALATDVPTMILVADVMQSQQKYSQSEPLLRTALRHDPRNPTALFLLGRVLTIEKRFLEAESVLKRSVAVSPSSFVSYTLLGSLYLRSGQFARAEQTLRKALKVITTNERKRLAQEFEEVGDGFMTARRKKDAARVYKQAKSLDPGNKSVSQKLARITM